MKISNLLIALLLVSSRAYSNIIPSLESSFGYDEMISSPLTQFRSCDVSAIAASPNRLFQEVQEISETIIGKKETFVDRVLERYSIREGENYASTLITLRLRPEEWEYYYMLQHEIAKRIPDENKRPTIDLTITASLKDRVLKSVGIAGGTGPLSDCEVLKQIMTDISREGREVNWNEFAINLFSSPPPRTQFAMVTRPSYFSRMAAFATRGHNKYYLNSNTAHGKIGKFKAMVASTQIRTGSELKQDSVQDLVNYVSQGMVKSSSGEKPSVLVLGTSQAYDDDTYPNYLEQAGLQSPQRTGLLAHSSASGIFYTLSTSTRALRLQSYIDLAKHGDLQKAGEQISKFILEEVDRIQSKGGRVNRVILGCTEIPMALHGNLLKDLQEKLNQKSQGHVELVNTEHLFAIKITEDIRKLQQ
jgi:aspartate/glutamate racemase